MRARCEEEAAADEAELVWRRASAREGSLRGWEGSLGTCNPACIPTPPCPLPVSPFPTVRAVLGAQQPRPVPLSVPGKAMAAGPQQLLEVCEHRLSRFLCDAQHKHLAWLREVEEQGMRMLKR